METEKINEIHSAVSQMREVFDKTTNKVESLEQKFESLSVDDKSKVEKINKFLDTFESYNQEFIKQKEEQKNKEEAFLKKLETLEKDNSELIKTLSYQMQSGSVDENEPSKELETTFAKLIKLEREDILLNHKDALNKFEGSVPVEGPASNNTIRTDINTKGGYYVHPAYANKIFKEASDVSQIETFCTVFTSNSKSLIVPVDKDEETKKTYFVDEAMEGEEETINADQREIVSYRQSVTIPVTRDQLTFSNKDIISLITEKVSNKLGKGASRAYLIGSHKNEPEGIMASDKVRSVESAATGVLDFDDIIGLPVADNFKSTYANPTRSKYYFNLRTLYTLRMMKDANGQYLWSPAVDSKAPSTINGFEYVIVSEMDDIAQGKCPVLFGDLKQAYAVLKTNGLTMIRDEYTNKRKAIIEYTWDRWLGGKIILPEAVRKLKIKE